MRLTGNRALLKVVGALLLASGNLAHGTGSVVVWGNNTYGQTNLPAGLTNVLAIATHGDHSLALRDDGSVISWGDNVSGQTNTPASLTNATQIAGSVSSSFAVRPDGSVVAWGKAALPIGLDHVVAIACGSLHNLVVRADGTVVAWGDNFNGQTSVPSELNRVKGVAAGEFHSIALKKNGTVVAWGDNEFGQTDVPEGLTNVTAVAVGSFHNLALRSDGTVVAWGRNDFGACDLPTGLSNVVSVAAGDLFSLALKQDGRLVFWGYDTSILSQGAQTLSNVFAIAAGISHCVALTNDGAPVIVREPTAQFAYESGTASFSVAALGQPTLAFQWFANGLPLADRTNAWLTFEQVVVADAGLYWVVVSNQFGSVTSPAQELTVITNRGAPFIVSQPYNARAVPGGNTKFAVEATGEKPLSYQWFFNQTNAIPEANGEVLLLTNLSKESAGGYSVLASNALGVMRSTEVSLSLVDELAWVFDTGSPVFSSPALTSEGILYVGSTDGRVFSLSRDGGLLWQFDTHAGVQAPPAIGLDGTIYIGSGDGRFYALAPDGTEKWHFQTGNTIQGAAALGADGTVYVNSRDGNLYALSQKGTEKWHYTSGEYYNDMSPVIGPDATIYIGVGSKIHALDSEGNELWDQEVGVVGSPSGNISVVIGPVGRLYATSGGDGMRMVAFTHEGKRLWSFPFGAPTAMTFPPSPAIGADGTIYIATSDSYLYAINPDGSLKWKTATARTQSSPALSSDGKIYLNSDWDFRLLCYDLQGVFQWEYLFGGQGAMSGEASVPNLMHGVAYFGSGNGKIYAFNVDSELAGRGWPTFAKNAQHSGRDIQRRIQATVKSGTGQEELKLLVEPGLHYRLQGSTDLSQWFDCANFESITAEVTLPRPKAFSFFRLVSP